MFQLVTSSRAFVECARRYGVSLVEVLLFDKKKLFFYELDRLVFVNFNHSLRRMIGIHNHTHPSNFSIVKCFFRIYI